MFIDNVNGFMVFFIIFKLIVLVWVGWGLVDCNVVFVLGDLRLIKLVLI